MPGYSLFRTRSGYWLHILSYIFVLLKLISWKLLLKLIILICTGIKFNSNNTNNVVDAKMTHHQFHFRATRHQTPCKHLEVVLTTWYGWGRRRRSWRPREVKWLLPWSNMTAAFSSTQMCARSHATKAFESLCHSLPLYRWGNQGLERFRNTPKLTQAFKWLSWNPRPRSHLLTTPLVGY